MTIVFTTLNTILSDIFAILRRSDVADTESISKRRVEDKVHQVRALLLKRDLDKGKKPNPDYIQEIGNLKLIPVELTGEDLTTLGIPSGLKIYRTELQIPTTLDLNFSSGFTYIGTPTGEEIQLIPEGRWRWQQYKKYTAYDRLAFLRNKYLYVINQEALEFITIKGIFEVPSEVGLFINPITDQPYFDYDSKYPIPITMLNDLKSILLKSEFGVELNSPTDVTNDSASNPQ